METTTVSSKTAGKPTGLILFAIVVIAAMLIVITAVGDATAGKVSAGTAQANATQAARCGMDEQTYTVQLPARARYDIQTRALCSSPAEIQP